MSYFSKHMVVDWRSVFSCHNMYYDNHGLGAEGILSVVAKPRKVNMGK